MNSLSLPTSTRSPEASLLTSLEGVVIGAFALLTPMLRARRCRAGTQGDESVRALPGDDLIPQPRWAATHAITIQAAPARIWPWIVQIGQGRGGYYSYEGLENVVGCQITNADRILPQFQSLRPGDLVALHPAANAPKFKVNTLVPERYLLFGAAPAFDAALQGTVGQTWLFYLDPQPDGSTRLLARTRAWYDRKFGLQMAFGPLLMEPIMYTMEMKMLKGIRDRAESA